MKSSSSHILASAGLIVLGMAIIGLNDNFVRFIAPHGGLWQFQFVRSAVAVPILLAIMVWQGSAFRIVSFSGLLWRTFAMTASIFLYFATIPIIPIAHVGAGLFTAPIWVLVWSVLLFKLRVGPWRIGAIVLGFLGVVLILRPESGAFSAWVLLPLAGGALYGLANLLTREWCAAESTSVVTLVFFVAMGIVGVLVSAGLSFGDLPQATGDAAFLLQGWKWAPAPFWFWSSVQAVLALAGVALINRGYLGAETSAIAVFEYSYLIFAGFWGWVLWSQNLAPRDLAGIGLIVAAGAIIAWRGQGRPDQAALESANRP